MQADRGEIIQDNPGWIQIRRGNDTLPYQAVRLVRRGGSGRWSDGEAGREARGSVIVIGDTGLDIQPGDRFNDDQAILYRVIMVRPTRYAGIEAEAEMVE